MLLGWKGPPCCACGRTLHCPPQQPHLPFLFIPFALGTHHLSHPHPPTCTSIHPPANSLPPTPTLPAARLTSPLPSPASPISPPPGPQLQRRFLAHEERAQGPRHRAGLVRRGGPRHCRPVCVGGTGGALAVSVWQPITPHRPCTHAATHRHTHSHTHSHTHRHTHAHAHTRPQDGYVRVWDPRERKNPAKVQLHVNKEGRGAVTSICAGGWHGSCDTYSCDCGHSRGGCCDP